MFGLYEDLNDLDDIIYECAKYNKEFDLNYYDFSPVSEGYSGKTPNLLKIEHLLGKLHNQVGPYLGDRLMDRDVKFTFDKHDLSYKNLNMYDNPIIKEINALFKKEFGFKDFELHFEYLQLPNAYTFIDSFIFNDITQKKLWDFTKHGEKYYDTEHYMCVYVQTFTRNCRIFTPEEHMGIILHEIGHNFDRSLAARISYMLTIIHDIPGIGKLNIFDNLVCILVLLLGSRFGKLYGLIQDLVNKIYGPLFNMLGYWQRLLMYLHTLRRFKNISASFISFAHDPLHAVIKQFTVGQEVFADSFATACGYGPALSSALVKLDQDYSLAIGNRYVDGAIYDVEYGLVLTNMILDEHPDTLSRISLNMKNLEKISKDPNLPPKYRAQVAKDLKKSREIYERYRDINDADRASIIRKIAYFAGDKIFGGQMDLRTFIVGVSACDVPPHDVASDSEIRNFIDKMISGRYRDFTDWFSDTIVDKGLKPRYKPLLSIKI